MKGERDAPTVAIRAADPRQDPADITSERGPVDSYGAGTGADGAAVGDSDLGEGAGAETDDGSAGKVGDAPGSQFDDAPAPNEEDASSEAAASDRDVDDAPAPTLEDVAGPGIDEAPGPDVRPHLLIMTATPIPRTMAQAVHADLDQSIIDELPPGRKAVATRWLGRRERERAYEYIRHRVRQGEQAYIVVPLVEGSGDAGPAAVDEHDRLSREVFPDLRLGLIHGRMTADEKELAMARFRSGETQVLVATTVIEVGVDVANATVMLVDGADRFGLAQLHQLRGRVGRGEAASACLLIADEPSEAARQRLEAMTRTTDGLALAEMDLDMRGPGDFLGVQQSGIVDRFRFARRVDAAVLDEARRAADELLQQDPALAAPESHQLAEAVGRFRATKERA